ncbi:SusC/RagA family TonB-linked outer membrane protein [Parapedobacter sp. DT-150]|uniref:SusC/RagA family TonB-linked outer membrane protein n=1 Tax=Parapedobacter sp. DT-150 TaxID=3396162 RepID=UPI003F1BFDEC
MKLAVFLTVLCTFQAIAETKAQKVTLNLRNTTLRDVMKEIQKQQGYLFFFRGDQIATKRVSVDLKQVELSDAMNRILENQGLVWSIKNKTIIVKRGTPSVIPAEADSPPMRQQRTITGRVTDETGQPIEGVTVTLKGTSIGTTTDAEGRYNIAVADEAGSLVFSMVGYDAAEQAIGTSQTVNVTLTTAMSDLEEVVVVGYGTQSARQVSSAISKVDAEDFADLPVAQFSQKLQGKLAGVQIAQATGTPGGGMNIRVRGAASINAGASPLYVVDGNPITGGISNINPNEIESISVLKDAAATALYGSRAANGVVLIETKKARPGETTLDYSGFAGVQQIPNRGRPVMMNAREFAEWRKEMAEFRGQPVDPEYQDPSQYGEGTNWYDALTRVAGIHDHSVTLSTGGEKFSTTATAGYFKQEGVVVASKYDRVSLRINSSFRPHEKVNIGLNIAPTYSRNTNSGVDGVGSVFNETLQTSPLAPLRNPDGSLTLTASSPGMFPTPNYVRTLEDKVVDNKNTRILANLFVEYEIIEGLSFKTSGNIDKGENRDFNFNGTTTGTRGTGLYTIPFSTLNQGAYLSWVNENILNYRADLGEDHHLDALAGFTAQRFRQDGSTINANNYPDDKVQTIGAAGTVEATSSIQEWSLASFLARINYNYKGRYLLSASIRRDGSSRFGKENRWGNFPSLSLGWIVSDEGFMDAMESISFLKLRASFGVVGNFDIGNYTHIPTISSANYVFGNRIGAGRTVDNLADQYIGWENNKEYNLGLDINFFNDRLGLTYNFYQKYTTDLLFNVRVPRASGFSSTNTNIGDLKFWGHEISIFSSNIKRKDFSWDTDFNLSFDRNLVTSMGTRTSEIITGPGSDLIGGSHITKEGQPIGMLYGMDHQGVYVNQADFDSSPKHSSSQVGTAKFRDVNEDGVITVEDATIIGNPHPDFVFGMTNRIQYKDFDFSMTLSGTYGNQILRGAEQTLTNLDGVFNVLANVKDHWRSPEDPGSGRYGSLAAGTTYLERDWWGTQMLYDGSHLSINNVTVGYNIPTNKSNFVRRFRVYGSVQQLHVFTNYPGSNPQVSLSQSSTQLGIDGGSYPVPRTYTLGLNIGF